MPDFVTREEVESIVRSEVTGSESRLRSEIAETEGRLRQEIIGAIAGSEGRLRTEIAGAIAGSEGRLRQEINGVYTSLKADMARKDEVDKQRFDALMTVVVRNEKETRSSLVEIYRRLDTVESDVKKLKTRKGP